MCCVWSHTSLLLVLVCVIASIDGITVVAVHDVVSVVVYGACVCCRM